MFWPAGLNSAALRDCPVVGQTAGACCLQPMKQSAGVTGWADAVWACQQGLSYWPATRAGSILLH